MKKKLLFIIINLFLTYSYAQDLMIDWVTTENSVTNAETYGRYLNYSAVDSEGNIYQVLNYSAAFDADPGVNTFILPAPSSSSRVNMGIRKLDPNGNLLWAKYISSFSNNQGGAFGIAIDSFKNIYITGRYNLLVDFNPDSVVNYLTPEDSSGDSFLLKLDTDGNYVWAKTLDGESDESGVDDYISIKIDINDNIYVSGREITSTGQAVAIRKYSPSGVTLWRKYFGGNLQTFGGGAYYQAEDLHIDSSNNILVTGYFTGKIIIEGVTYENTNHTYQSLFVLKLDTNGSIIFVKTAGLNGSGYARCRGISIATDSNDNIYTAGLFTNTIDFDPSSGTNFLVSDSGTSAYSTFIQKLDASGNFIWAKGLEGIDGSRPSSVAVDPLDNVYIAGHLYNTIDLDPGTGTHTLDFSTANAFILKLNGLGNFVWAAPFNSNDTSPISDMYFDNSHNFYITGHTIGTVDFDLTDQVQNETSPSYNTFIAKYTVQSLSANEPSFSNTISIYPNPSTDNIFFNTKNETQINHIKIFDGNGRKILSANTFENGVNISGLKSGIYHVEIKTNKGKTTKKLIVK